MQMNPVLKPRVATPTLIIASAVTLALAVVFVALLPSLSSAGWLLLATIATAMVVALFWRRRIRGRMLWRLETDAQWRRLESLKSDSGTTTEVTVVSVDAPQPTGAWITIRWDRFDYIQPAWIEALPEPIWPGSVLLIQPDPAQVRPGAPWPATYHIAGDRVLAWAPIQ